MSDAQFLESVKKKKTRQKRVPISTASTDPLHHPETLMFSEKENTETYKKIVDQYFNRDPLAISGKDINYHYRAVSRRVLESYGLDRYPGYVICRNDEFDGYIGDNPSGMRMVGGMVLLKQPIEIHNVILQEKHVRHNEKLGRIKNNNEKMSVPGTNLNISKVATNSIYRSSKQGV